MLVAAIACEMHLTFITSDTRTLKIRLVSLCS